MKRMRVRGEASSWSDHNLRKESRRGTGLDVALSDEKEEADDEVLLLYVSIHMCGYKNHVLSIEKGAIHSIRQPEATEADANSPHGARHACRV